MYLVLPASKYPYFRSQKKGCARPVCVNEGEGKALFVGLSVTAVSSVRIVDFLPRRRRRRWQKAGMKPGEI